MNLLRVQKGAVAGLQKGYHSPCFEAKNVVTNIIGDYETLRYSIFVKAKSV